MIDRLPAETPCTDPAEAASLVNHDATVCVSGFGSVGYPKAVPLALAESGRDLVLTLISGGSVGDEIDTELVEADAIARRYPFQARRAVRTAINQRRIQFQDRHIARLGEAVLLGDIPSPDVAIVEAVAAGDGWLIPSTSIGQTRAFVEAANDLIIEINRAQPRSLRHFHDIYRVGPPPRDGYRCINRENGSEPLESRSTGPSSTQLSKPTAPTAPTSFEHRQTATELSLRTSLSSC